MKVFISADIEGVTGVTSWSETRYGGQGYEEACRQMGLEVKAACDAAIELGYEVVVKDGHEDALNLDPWQLPRGVQLIRGWRTSPEAMMGGLDATFDACLYLGYHSAEGTNSSPLAHTIEHELFNWMKINGKLASEFSMNALWAAYYGVPSVFLSGDEGICSHGKEVCPGLVTVATKACTGNSTWNLHPQDALEQIREGVKAALQQKPDLISPEEKYSLQIHFKEHQNARNASWYPGAKLIDSNIVEYTAKDVRDLMVGRMFMTGI